MSLEKLSLWDRWFNRYLRTVHARGDERWGHFTVSGDKHTHQRDWIEYKITDRVTGSVIIEREYIN